MEIRTKNSNIVMVGLAAAILLAGCASPSSDDQFGSSVRQMIEAQKYVPPQQAHREVPLMDGRKAEAGYTRYRTEAADPARMSVGGAVMMTQP